MSDGSTDYSDAYWRLDGDAVLYVSRTHDGKLIVLNIGRVGKVGYSTKHCTLEKGPILKLTASTGVYFLHPHRWCDDDKFFPNTPQAASRLKMPSEQPSNIPLDIETVAGSHIRTQQQDQWSNSAPPCAYIHR
jgi:hypothetical protein